MQASAARLNAAPQSSFTRAHGARRPSRLHLAVRAAANGVSAGAPPDDVDPTTKLLAKTLAVAAAGVVSVVGVDKLATANLMPAAMEAISAAESTALVVGTAAASSVATAAAALGITKRAEREAQARQRARLEKLRVEVVKLQELQQQELQLLQMQMNAKAQDFNAAWERLQDELTHESSERQVASQEAAAAASKAARLEEVALVESQERARLQSINRLLEEQLSSQAAEYAAMEGQAADLAARLDRAKQDVAEATTLLEASRSRTAMLEKSWAEAVAAQQAERGAAAEASRAAQERAARDASLLAAKTEEAERARKQLEEVQANAAAARALLAAAQSRNSVLDKAFAAASQESMELAAEKRRLAAALADAQRQVKLLGSQLEAARALRPQLEEARRALAATETLLSTAHSRNAMLEKAWSAASKDAKVEQAARQEAQRQLEWTQRRVRDLTAELAHTETSVTSSAAGVEELVDQLNRAMAQAQSPAPVGSRSRW